jgi:hypothetical protein
MPIIERNAPGASDEIGVTYDRARNELFITNTRSAARCGAMFLNPQPLILSKLIQELCMDCFEAGERAALARVRRTLGIES